MTRHYLGAMSFFSEEIMGVGKSAVVPKWVKTYGSVFLAGLVIGWTVALLIVAHKLQIHV